MIRLCAGRAAGTEDRKSHWLHTVGAGNLTVKFVHRNAANMIEPPPQQAPSNHGEGDE